MKIESNQETVDGISQSLSLYRVIQYYLVTKKKISMKLKTDWIIELKRDHTHIGCGVEMICFSTWNQKKKIMSIYI